ncbi:DUF6035 family protein [Verrucomicrobia bacterium]|nr:DUF6035 family protein [Verrucomicrobiota bacterium]
MDVQTCEVLSASKLLDRPELDQFQLRHELERNRKWMCSLCYEPVKLRGGPNRKLHFWHGKNSPGCPVETGLKLSKKDIEKRKWNGQKEGPAHKRLKQLIEKSLRADNSFSDIRVEQRQISKSEKFDWRRPDVAAKRNERQFVFEIQLSTTFLTVIIGRSRFYKDQDTFLCWVFDDFSTLPNQQKFTEKDILYSNNCNVFVANDETLKQSVANQELTLECYYMVPKYPESNEADIQHEWCSETVRFSDLNFVEDECQLFYFDHRKQYEEVESELKKKRKEEKARLDRQIRESNFETEIDQIVTTYRWSYLEGYESLRVDTEPIDKDNLEKRESRTLGRVSFIRNEERPYTGWVKIILKPKSSSESASLLSEQFGERIVGLEYYYLGKKDGNAHYWYGDGARKGIGKYRDGLLLSAVSWLPNGEICPIAEIDLDGNGVLVEYDDNGMEQKRIYYRNGRAPKRRH